MPLGVFLVLALVMVHKNVKSLLLVYLSIHVADQSNEVIKCALDSIGDVKKGDVPVLSGYI